MKWVLLLGVIVSLASGRTIFDYERDGLDNKQEGSPGQAVSGFYEWRGPDGKVTEVSYVADHLGFRLLEDLELRPPTEPFRPAESTPPESDKSAKATQLRGMEEEEEEENEGEEEEEEETESEGEEESEGDENSEDESADQEEETNVKSEATEENTNEDGEASEAEGNPESEASEVEGNTKSEASETEGNSESEASEKGENEATAEEGPDSAAADNSDADTETADKTSKALDEAGTGKQEVNIMDENKDQKEPAHEMSSVAEVNVVIAGASSANDPALAEIDVLEKTSLELDMPQADGIIPTAEIFPVAEPMVAPLSETVEVAPLEETADVLPTVEMLSESESKVAPLDDIAVIIPTAEMLPASEPLVAPVEEIIPLSKSLSTAEDINIVPIPISLPLKASALERHAIPTNEESLDSVAAIVIVGDFVPNNQEASINLDSSNIFEENYNTATVNKQGITEISEPAIDSVVEYDVVAIPETLLPVPEPFQQPKMDVAISSIDALPLVESKTAEVILSPERTSSPLSGNAPLEPVIVARHIESPRVKFVDMPTEVVQVEGTTAIKNSPVDSPLPSPLQQMQVVEIEEYSPSNLKPIEITLESNQNSATFVNMEKASNINEPTIEIELSQSDVSSLGRSMDSVPVLVKKTDHSSLSDTYFIPEELQVPHYKPEQNAVSFVEISVPQEDMIIKAKALSQPQVPRNIRVTSNELEKPISSLSFPDSDSIKVIQMTDFADTNYDSMQSSAVPVPVTKGFSQGSIKLEENSMPAQFIEVPVVSIKDLESLSDPINEESMLISVQDSVGSDQYLPLPEDTVVVASNVEKVVPVISPVPLTSVKTDQITGSPFTAPPLLPPLMKVSRILN